MVILNIPRIILYVLFIVLGIKGVVPWWVPVGILLHDARWVSVFRLPVWAVRLLFGKQPEPLGVAVPQTWRFPYNKDEVN